jgi:hypothetical protein
LCGAGTGHWGKCIRNTWKVLKWGAGEGWRWSIGPIVWQMRKCYSQSKRSGTFYIQYHILHGTALWENTSVKKRQKRRKDEEEGVASTTRP